MSDFIADTNLGHTTDLNSMKAANSNFFKRGFCQKKRVKNVNRNSKLRMAMILTDP